MLQAPYTQALLEPWGVVRKRLYHWFTPGFQTSLYLILLATLVFLFPSFHLPPWQLLHKLILSMAFNANPKDWPRPSSLLAPLRPSLTHPYPRLQVITVGFISYLSSSALFTQLPTQHLFWGDQKPSNYLLSWFPPQFLPSFQFSEPASTSILTHKQEPMAFSWWIPLVHLIHGVYQQVLCTEFPKPSSDPSS